MVSGILAMNAGSSDGGPPPMGMLNSPEVKLDLSTRELRSLKAVHRDQAGSDIKIETVGRVLRNKQLYLGRRLKSRDFGTLTFPKS